MSRHLAPLPRRRAAAIAAAMLLGGSLAACRDEAPPVWSDHGGPAATAAADSLSDPADEPAAGTERRAGAQAAPGELPPVAAMREAVAVQVGGSRDSAGAARLRDSLAAAGWEAVVRRSGRDTLPWRVHVAPTREQALAEATRVGFALRGQPAALVTDSMRTGGPTIGLVAVHHGPYGVGRARWTLSPDRQRLLVVEEQAGDAGQVLPDAFVYASEADGVVVQRPAVWSVAPDPAWTRLAYGRAFLIPGDDAPGGGVSRPWYDLTSYTNLELSAVRRGAFRIEDRRGLSGFAQPAIEWVHADSQAVSELARLVNAPVPMAGGWRVRWSTDGRTLAVGLTPPSVARDDAAPSAWVAVDPRSHVARGEVRSYVALADVSWTTGPALPSDAALDPAPHTLEVEGGTVESRDGWVTVRSALTGGRPRALGPGRALAATRTGRFVVAVAPALDASGRRATQRLVVYRLR